MSKRERISPIIRGVSGIIGILGFVAIYFNATQDSGIKLDFMRFMRFLSFYASSILVFVAFFGRYPWDSQGADTAESQALSALWHLRHMEWLPMELFHVVLTRNGITTVLGGSGAFYRPIASGALTQMAIQLRRSGVITDTEYDVIVTPSIEEKQEKMRRYDLL